MTNQHLKHYEPITTRWGTSISVSDAPSTFPKPSIKLTLSGPHDERTTRLTLDQTQQLVAMLATAIVNHPHFAPKDL
jgi:hypothetical protein